MSVLVQVATNWLMLGALYTLVASGLSLIFSVMRIINFAQGQFYMLGAFGLFALYGQGDVPYPAALLIVALVLGFLGVVVERVIVRPVAGDESRAMIATLGLLLALQGGALAIWGETNRFVDQPVSGGVTIGGAAIQGTKLLAAGAALALVALLVAALRWTRSGRALRALSQSDVGARLQGIRVGRLRALGFGVGSALAGLAGALILPLTSVSPDIGNPILLKMFIVLILGGLGSIVGALAGAFALAGIETIGVNYFGQYSILGAYLLVMAVILVKPTGLLARE